MLKILADINEFYNKKLNINKLLDIINNNINNNLDNNLDNNINNNLNNSINFRPTPGITVLNLEDIENKPNNFPDLPPSPNRGDEPINNFPLSPNREDKPTMPINNFPDLPPSPNKESTFTPKGRSPTSSSDKILSIKLPYQNNSNILDILNNKPQNIEINQYIIIAIQSVNKINNPPNIDNFILEQNNKGNLIIYYKSTLKVDKIFNNQDRYLIIIFSNICFANILDNDMKNDITKNDDFCDIIVNSASTTPLKYYIAGQLNNKYYYNQNNIDFYSRYTEEYSKIKNLSIQKYSDEENKEIEKNRNLFSQFIEKYNSDIKILLGNNSKYYLISVPNNFNFIGDNIDKALYNFKVNFIDVIIKGLTKDNKDKYNKALLIKTNIKENNISFQNKKELGVIIENSELSPKQKDKFIKNIADPGIPFFIDNYLNSLSSIIVFHNKSKSGSAYHILSTCEDYNIIFSDSDCVIANSCGVTNKKSNDTFKEITSSFNKLIPINDSQNVNMNLPLVGKIRVIFNSLSDENKIELVNNLGNDTEIFSNYKFWLVIQFCDIGIVRGVIDKYKRMLIDEDRELLNGLGIVDPDFGNYDNDKKEDIIRILSKALIRKLFMIIDKFDDEDLVNDIRNKNIGLLSDLFSVEEFKDKKYDFIDSIKKYYDGVDNKTRLNATYNKIAEDSGYDSNYVDKLGKLGLVVVNRDKNNLDKNNLDKNNLDKNNSDKNNSNIIDGYNFNDADNIINEDNFDSATDIINVANFRKNEVKFGKVNIVFVRLLASIMKYLDSYKGDNKGDLVQAFVGVVYRGIFQNSLKSEVDLFKKKYNYEYVDDNYEALFGVVRKFVGVYKGVVGVVRFEFGSMGEIEEWLKDPSVI
jgi:hypothetical protein